MKIGQEITIKEDLKIESFQGRQIQVKKGDKAFVNSRGVIQYTTGQARGMMQCVNDIEVKGYDYSNIAKMILNRLNGVYSVENFFDDEDIHAEEVELEIEDVLMDIL